MKLYYIIIALGFFFGSIFSINAQDLIILRDGNVIEARVTEISPTEIRYRRFNHLDGPIIVIAGADVLSIRYENTTVEIINPISVSGQDIGSSDIPALLQSGEPTLLQQALNRLPAIPIAGNNLKFEFRGETWIATVNGESFSAGKIEFEANTEGGILTLRQTHIWPGAVGRTAGRVANVIPGGSAVSGALNTAGNIAGAVGAVEISGTVIVLEYKAGPPSSLRLLSTSQDGTANTRTANNQAEKSANIRNNWMSYELALWGIGVRYERMLNSNISFGLNFYWGPPPLIEYFDINTFFRIYPWGKTFFLGVGLGYTHLFSDNYGIYDAFEIVPEIGWKIDVGNPGGFYLMPCLTFSAIIDGSGFGYSRLIYFGIGHAF